MTRESRYVNSKDIGIAYFATNEPLVSIMKGLSIGGSDSVFSILGSFDQSAAILEKSGELLAVDNNQAQLRYALKRVEALKSGDYEGFLDLERRAQFILHGGNTDYFSKERFEKIRSNLSNLTLKLMDVLKEGFPEGIYNKIYLSNILTYGANKEKDFSDVLNPFINQLEPGSLIYLASGPGSTILDYDNIEISSHLTNMAQEGLGEGFLPIVLRKKRVLDTKMVTGTDLKHLLSQVYFKLGKKEKAYANEIYFKTIDALINQARISDYLKEIVRLGVIAYQETIKEAIPKGYDRFFEHVEIMEMAKKMPSNITRRKMAQLGHDNIYLKIHKSSPGYGNDFIINQILEFSKFSIACRATQIEKKGDSELANRLKRIEEEIKMQ